MRVIQRLRALFFMVSLIFQACVTLLGHGGNTAITRPLHYWYLSYFQVCVTLLGNESNTAITRPLHYWYLFSSRQMSRYEAMRVVQRFSALLDMVTLLFQARATLLGQLRTLFIMVSLILQARVALRYWAMRVIQRLRALLIVLSLLYPGMCHALGQ